MKKKIANAIQLALLIFSFILLCIPVDRSAIGSMDGKIIPMCALYILNVVMCIISIVSKNTHKDGKAHGAVAILLLVVSLFCLVFSTTSYEPEFQGGLFIGLHFAAIVVAFAKRSSLIAESKEAQQTVVNNIQETTNADELKKYKDLLDSGAITQEEFDAKKKELLGL